jgi:hypothetical protein
VDELAAAVGLAREPNEADLSELLCTACCTAYECCIDDDRLLAPPLADLVERIWRRVRLLYTPESQEFNQRGDLDFPALGDFPLGFDTAGAHSLLHLPPAIV